MPPRKNANKRPKDLNAPKRPASAYIRFNKSRQKTLRAEQPDKKLTELTKVVGAEWNAMTPEQKEPFESEANEAKERYKTEMEEYKKTDLFEAFQQKLKAWKRRQAHPDESSGESGDDDDDAPPRPAPKRPKDPNAPKKPLSAFFIFQSGRRQELKALHPDKKNTEFSKMAGAEWKAMSDEQKQPFESQAAERKTAYQQALAAYKQTDEFRQYEAAVARWKEAKKNPPKKKKKKVRAPSPRSDDESEESSGSESESSAEDEDGDTRMHSRRPSSSSDEEYSSDESD